jgi:RimJ/RimL family protein N-acetyltransferase
MPPNIRLRRTEPRDLEALFAIQSDPESNTIAGTKPRSREVFFSRWDSIFTDPKVNGQVIEELRADNPSDFQLVGSIACFQVDASDPTNAAGGTVATHASGDTKLLNCVGYWIARPHWGRGIASRALELFLGQEPRRPLHATTAANNSASRHILENAGFRCTGTRWGDETDRYLARDIADFVLE